MYSFIDRDEDYFKELRRLNNSVVITFSGLDITAEHIVDWAVATGLVHFNEVAVAKLKEGKYLLNLPEGLVPETFIRATPPTLWEQGISFQQWSMLHEAAVNIPMFKVRLELSNIPDIHWRESEVIRAVSNFGVYLGTMWPADESREVWTAVVAVDDLCRIPHEITMVAGGLEHDVMVDPVDWAIGPIYKREDLPTLPPKYTKPATARPSPQVKALFEDEQMIPMSRSVLLDLCRGKDEATLPLVVKAALAGARSSAPYEGRECDEAMNLHLNRLYESVGQHEAGWKTKRSIHCAQTEQREPQKILLHSGERNLQSGPSDRLRLQTASDPEVICATHSMQQDSHIPHEAVSHQIQNNPLFIPHNDSPPASVEAELSGGKRQPMEGSVPQNVSSQKGRRQSASGSTLAGTLGEAGQVRGKETGPGRRTSSATPQKTPKGLHNKQNSSVLGPTPVIRKGQHVAQGPNSSSSKDRKQGHVMRRRRKTLAPGDYGAGPSTVNGDNGPSAKSPCQVDLDPQGFFNVHVQYSHCTDIASGSGLPISDVLAIVEEDNRARETAHLRQQEEPPNFEDSDPVDEDERVDYSLTDDEMDSDPEEVLF